jgi:hypothetical protein
MREHETAFQKHLSHIMQAQLLAQTPQNNQQNDISRVFQKVERGTGALIEDALTSQAPERPIAKQGFLPLFLRGGGYAVRAIHGSLLMTMFCLLQAYPIRSLNTRFCSQF